LIQICVRKI